MEKTLHKTKSHHISQQKRSFIERFVLITVIICLAVLAGLASFFVFKQLSQFGVGLSQRPLFSVIQPSRRPLQVPIL
jgi:hypothetical protein